jgi:hypothetical protein
MKELSDSCITISFPRLHNDALFPIFHKNYAKLTNEIYGINKTISSLGIEDRMRLYDCNLLDFNFKERYTKNYEIGKIKESECDVKIVDWIYNNVSNHKLFLTQDHPTSIVFREIVNEICNILDIEHNIPCSIDENIAKLKDTTYSLSNNQYPISRYAIKEYNFKYIDKEDKNSDIFYKNILKSI